MCDSCGGTCGGKAAQAQSTFVIALDNASRRVKSPQGYLTIHDSRIARSGIQRYTGAEMGLKDAKRIVSVYRPPEEVFSADSLASFEGLPLTLRHPNGFVDATNWGGLAVGFVRNVRQSDTHVIADLVVTDKKAIDAIEAGTLTELSNGYDHGLEWVEGGGMSPDGPYDAVQRGIRGNHVALVEHARCGPSCRVSDNQQKETQMSDNLRHVAVDGKSVAVNDAAAETIERLLKERDESRSALDAAKTAATDSATKIADLNKKVDDLEKTQANDAFVSDLVQAIDQAKSLASDVEIKGDATAIRRAVLGKVYDANKAVVDAALCGVALDAAPAETVKTVLAVVAAAKGTKTEDAAATGVINPLASHDHAAAKREVVNVAHANAKRYA